MFGIKRKKDKSEQLVKAESDQREELFFEGRKTLKELVSPCGVNPNPLDYLVVNDNGIDLYTMCFYINAFPTAAVFASTFAPLFNSAGVTSTVFVEPMLDGKSSKQLDKRIIMLDSELYNAETNRDRNRYRKVQAKMQTAEKFAADVESGNNRLYEVAFLFTLQAVSLDKLRMFVNDFHSIAKGKGIELSACYGVHPEAFISGYPTNKIYKASYGIGSVSVIKKHVFDKGSLTTIFNHTRTSFFHKNGVILGKNMSTGQPETFDPYDYTHKSYSVVITGKTGFGKSATMKMLISRLVDFMYNFVIIDFESRGTRGEYAMLTEKMGGINYLISAKSDCILNIFEIGLENLFDEFTGREYQDLKLKEKITNVVYLLMIIIKDGKVIEQFNVEIKIKRVITDVVTSLYAKLGIHDGEPDSLYESTTGYNKEKIACGQIKKKMPTLTDFYKEVLQQQKANKDDLYVNAYQIILDTIKDYVRELYYDPKTLTTFTKQEYEYCRNNDDTISNDESHSDIIAIKGTKPYFDGQSTIQYSVDTPIVNYDISQLQAEESERAIAMLVCMSLVKENHIKKNSQNVKKANKMIIVVDEVARLFPRKEARIFLDDCYRTGRKRNVSMWTLAQALSDFNGYEETKSIVRNACTKMLFKQDFSDRQFIKDVTPLTDSQIDQVVTLGGTEEDCRYGEICMIDNEKVTFNKVDYLTSSEAQFVETDLSKIEKMYEEAYE